jgi:tetratricopeptide (TPR) repeat protein
MPARHRPDFAESLSNLGLVYRDLGRTAEALPFMREAVDGYKELTLTDPGRYGSNLAIARENLADALSSTSRNLPCRSRTAPGDEAHVDGQQLRHPANVPASAPGSARKD